MAAKEMYDYLSSATADYTAATLQVYPKRVLTEIGNKHVAIHEGDDGSEERVAISTTSIFYVDLQWDTLTASDAGTIFDFYHDTAKGCGTSRTFKWAHPTDGHTYVARFDGDMPRQITAPEFHGFNLKLKILGYTT